MSSSSGNPGSLGEAAEYEFLQTPRAIRERSERIFSMAQAEQLEHFQLDEARLDQVARRVLAITRRTYPDLSRIPYHGRYRHFDVGGVPRLQTFDAKLQQLTADERLAAHFELVITSVLLDAGAGQLWQYRAEDGELYTRSEGLAVASFELYMAGVLGGERAAPVASAAGLAAVTESALGRAFQVSAQNPLTGLAGRAALLRRLGEVVSQSARYFGASGRLGQLGVWLKNSANAGRLDASRILAALLDALGPIWQGRQQLAGKSLGDVWRHSHAGFVPFHKLSQWLSYSLFEPLEASGVTIVGASELTGLAEYRNGGLYIDSGVLKPRDDAAFQQVHSVDSDLVIEWRALTVALLDRTARDVRRLLGLSAEQLPLARILEGGTWRAGRAIALEMRGDGRPPLSVESDGTVF